MSKPRLTDGDVVQVVNVPDNMAKWRGRIGRIKGIRGEDRTWTVWFEGRKKSKVMVFRRHELQKLRSRMPGERV